jgi:hypothetical protein
MSSPARHRDRIVKQVCFFRKRPDMSMEEFIDYYEKQHSRLSARLYED